MCIGLQFDAGESATAKVENWGRIAGSCGVRGRAKSHNHEGHEGKKLRRDAQDEQGDVVGTTALQGHFYQREARVRRRVGPYDGRDVLLADQAPESVGTEQQ